MGLRMAGCVKDPSTSCLFWGKRQPNHEPQNTSRMRPTFSGFPIPYLSNRLFGVTLGFTGWGFGAAGLGMQKPGELRPGLG